MASSSPAQNMTAQSSDRSPWLPVALCAVPTVIGVLVSFLAAPGSGGDEVMREAQAVAFRAAFWPMLIGAAVSLFAAYRQLRGATVDPRWPQLLNAIAGGETAAVAAALRDAPEMAPELFRKLEGMQQRLTLDREVLREHRRTLESMAMTVTTLSEVAQQQGTEIESLAVALGAQGAAGSATTIDSLAHTAEESSSSVIEMVAINDEVRENIHNLALSVQETTTALEEMAFSSKEVARNIEELSTAAEETAASMNEMDVSIGQVETNANETSKISETVMRDAETGVSAINTTIRGIDKIKESSRVAAEVIGSLGQRISEIGNILNVIDDVAEQTNLLALNAAIIAAQAGEHGRGFAVVADEIKALAERTGASTKEIAGLIKTIQDESRRAVNVMSHGVEDVEEGVRLGHNAEEALRKIVDSAKRSTLMIQAIAQATVEQAKGSKQVTNAISRIAETVQQIAYASAEQAKGAEHIMQSAERMKMITQQVERSAEEQNRGGRQVTQAIERIREIAEEIDRAQQRQLRDAEGASRTVASQKLSSQRAVDGSQQASKLLGEAVRHLDRISGN